MSKPKASTVPTIDENWPTDPMGWLLAYTSRRVREGLIASFNEAGCRMSPEQWSILTQLWQEDGLPQQGLADRFHRSKVSAFHLISKLQEQGIVERRDNPADGRSKLIYLTRKGRAMIEELIPLAQGNLERALRGIPAADLDTARSVLYKVAVNTTP